MAVNLQSTNTISADGIKILAYGAAGSGKTMLIKTLPDPIILSAEGGLLTLADENIPFMEIGSMDELKEAYAWLTEDKDAKQFKSVALDSITEIAEVCLANEKKINKDPRAAYGEMQTTMSEVIRLFRDLKGKNVYMTAQLSKTTDEMGRVLYGPSMPGQKAGQSLPYAFDIVAAMRVEKDEDGVNQRALMMESDGLWQAKHRMGAKLEAWEAPDLGEIINKIGSK
jgi:phage nucleotide-binding protein